MAEQSQQSMFSAGDSRAKTYRWLGPVLGWLASGQDCSASSLASLLRSLPPWVLVENVPGLLSSGHKAGCTDARCFCCDPGADMGTVLGALADLGYGWAYRVLDAQYIGVAQRRRRVFIVGCLGDAARAAAVLLEPDCLPGNPAPSREEGQGVAATLGSQPEGSGWRGDTDRMTFVPALARCVATREGRQLDPTKETYVADTLRSHPRPGSNSVGALAFSWQAGSNPTSSGAFEHELSPTLQRNQTMAVAYSTKLHNTHSTAVAFAENQRGEVIESSAAPVLSNGGGKPGQGYPAVRQGMAVRRLTPLECERLQGFPDGWTEGFSDAVRYRMLGNAVAVPVARWIGTRLLDALGVAA